MRITHRGFASSGLLSASPAHAANEWRSVVDPAIALAGFTPEPLQAYARRAELVGAFKRDVRDDADVFRSALDSLASGGDIESVTADAAKAFAKADAIARLADVAGKFKLASEYVQAVNDSRPILIDALRPEFNKAAEELAKHAPKLDKDKPFDNDLAIKANASRAYMACQDAIDRILTVGELFGLPRSTAADQASIWNSVALRHIPAIVDPGKQERRVMDALSHNVIRNPQTEPARKAVSAMWKNVTGATVGFGLDSALEKRNADLPERERLYETLVKVAAGRYPGVVLSLAKDGTEIRDRFAAIVTAMTTIKPKED